MATISRRHRGVTLVVGLLGAAVLLAGCNGDPGTESPPDATETTSSEMRVFEADNGEIEIPVDPQRIVAVGNGVGPVIDLGVEPVGVTVSSTNTATRWFSPEGLAAYEAAEKVSDGADVDLEAVAGLEPDLIVIAVPPAPWEQNFAAIEDRFQSIAPTVFIQNNAVEWKAVGERIADAVGRSDVYNEQKADYDQLVADLREEFDSIIDSETFVQVNRYPATDEGSFDIEYAGNWCAAWATEAGFDFVESPDGAPSTNMSMERLSDLAEYDVIIYPLEADGEPREEFLPVLESNSWSALPQVESDRALGVPCPSGIGGYTSGVTNLEALREALSSMPAE